MKTRFHNTTSREKWNMSCTLGQIQSIRDEQEDRIYVEPLGEEQTLFIVADGHRGSRCVDFVIKFLPAEILKLYQQSRLRKNIKDLLLRAFYATNDAWAKEVLGDAESRFPENPLEREKIVHGLPKNFFDRQGDSGSTILCGIIDLKQSKMWFCNLGDSRVVFRQNDFLFASLDKKVPKVLSHLVGTAFETSTKVEADRLQGDLQMVSAIGDYTPNLLGTVQTTPAIQEFQIENTCEIVMATDGLWDVVKEQMLFLNPITDANSILETYGPKSTDNTSVIVIKITK